MWDSPQFRPVRDHAPISLAAAVIGVALLALLARLFLRRPTFFPLLAVAALPFRIPLNVGGQTANLLLPLYAVVAAGVLAYAWERLRPDPKETGLRPSRSGSALEDASNTPASSGNGPA